MVYLFTYLLFFSLVFRSFECAGLVCVLLDLCLGTQFRELRYTALFGRVSADDTRLRAETGLVFVCRLCVLQPGCFPLLVLRQFSCSLALLSWQSCSLCIGSVCLFLV